MEKMKYRVKKLLGMNTDYEDIVNSNNRLHHEFERHQHIAYKKRLPKLQRELRAGRNKWKNEIRMLKKTKPGSFQVWVYHRGKGSNYPHWKKQRLDSIRL